MAFSYPMVRKRQWPVIRPGLFWLLGGLLFAPLLQANDRALLIGIGHYQNSLQIEQPAYGYQGPIYKDLPGIDKDLAMMREVSADLGFSPGQIKTLKDVEATAANIKEAFNDWLDKGGVGENDRVLIYFSGNGSRVPDVSGDEDDGYDEILLTYDFTEQDGPRGKQVSHYISDDQFGTWLAAIPSKRVLVIIDACHSGTITRGINGNEQRPFVPDAVPKFAVHKGSPYQTGIGVSDHTFLNDSTGPARADNYLVLTASSAEELSQATPEGSLFTMGLYRAAVEAMETGHSLTPLQWLQAARHFIDDNTLLAQRYTPRVEGRADWENQPLAFNRQAQPVLAMASLDRLTSKSLPARQDGLQVRVLRETGRDNWRPGREFMVGDYMSFEVSSRKSGYVYLFERVRGTDRMRILFPNRWDGDNRLTANRPMIIGGDRSRRKMIVRNADHGGNEYYLLQTSSPVAFNAVADREMDRDDKAIFDRVLRISQWQSKGLYQADNWLDMAKVSVSTCTVFKDKKRKHCR